MKNTTRSKLPALRCALIALALLLTACPANFMFPELAPLGIPHIAVTGISGVPSTAQIPPGQSLALRLAAPDLPIAVTPADASVQRIRWEMGSPPVDTDARLLDNVIIANTPGTVNLRATIAGGGENRADFTASFDIELIDTFVPVSGISWTPASTFVQGPMVLPLNTALISPPDATYRDIVWTVVNAGSTDARIGADGQSLVISTPLGANPSVTLKAAIANGLSIEPSLSYEATFPITFNNNFVDVIDIANVGATGGVPSTLTIPRTGTLLYALNPDISPPTASVRTITWEIVTRTGTDAAVTNGFLTASTPGEVTLKATIVNGKTNGTVNYEETFAPVTINRTFVAVTGISGVPISGMPGGQIEFSACAVTPVDATAANETITWSVLSGGSVPGTFTGTTLTLTGNNTGTITVQASVPNGNALGSAFIGTFPVMISIIQVTNITGIPDTINAGDPVDLQPVIVPAYATSRTVCWSIVSDSTRLQPVKPVTLVNGGQAVAGAGIPDADIKAPSNGTIVIKAAVPGGAANGVDNYEKTFTINVVQVPVSGIGGVPEFPNGIMGGLQDGYKLADAVSVQPANASMRDIEWSYVSKAGSVTGYPSNIPTPSVSQDGVIMADLPIGLSGFDTTEVVVVTALIRGGTGTGAPGSPIGDWTKNYNIPVRKFLAIFTEGGYSGGSVTITYKDGTTKTLTRADTKIYSRNEGPSGNVIKSVTADGNVIMLGRKDNEIITLNIGPGGILRQRTPDGNNWIHIASRDCFKLINTGSVNRAKNYVLDGELDLMGDAAGGNLEWTPVGGKDAAAFMGSFDGKGFAIRNIKVISTGGSAGLFGEIGNINTYRGGSLKNVHLKEGTVQGNSTNTGGTATQTGTGGIAGGIWGGTIENCSNGAEVQGTDNVGGLIGYRVVAGIHGTQSINACKNTGDVTGSGTNAGGLFGRIDTGGSPEFFKACYNTGSVTGNINVGGVIGCFVGNATFRISACYSIAPAVTGSSVVGGIIGFRGVWGIPPILVANARNPYNDCWWTPPASNPPTNAVGAIADDSGATVFASGAWPTNNAAGDVNWGLVSSNGGNSGGGYWWGDLGGWNSGVATVYPKLWWEN